MEDLILIATVVAFFVAAALVVRVLDHMIVSSASDADLDDEAADTELEPGRPA